MKFFFSPKKYTTKHAKSLTGRGFTVLFSVLVASILLAVGASIFNITVKNLLFSSSGRESLRAFSAADTGLECAEYWDHNGGGLFKSKDTNGESPFQNTAQCVGKVITNVNDAEWDLDIVGDVYTTFFKINTETDQQNGICFEVTVTKKPKINEPEKITTVIDSRGYNTCTPSDRRLERAVRLTYDEL